jgi:prolyl oligopeptidase
MYMQESLEAEPKVFLDPNLLSEDGTVSLKLSQWSYDGSLMAYGLSQSGSDWSSIKVKKVESGEDYPETLEKIKFSSVAWTHDNKGFFYCCYPLHDPTKATGKDTASVENQKVYYHLVGETQDKDVLCVEFPEHPKWLIGCEVTDCGNYLLVTTHSDCKYNIVYLASLSEQCAEGIRTQLVITPLVPEKFEADYDYVTNVGTKFYYHTNKNAKRFKMVCIDSTNSEEANWQDVIPEHEKDVLEWVSAVSGDKLVTCYMHDVKNTMQLRSMNGEIVHDFDLAIGSVTGFSGDIRHSEVFYSFSSQIVPGRIYYVDLSNSSVTQKVHTETKLKNFNPDDFKLEQVFYPSKDGTKIPMFITMRKDFVPDGTSGCLLYGYGGFSHSITPYFSISQTYFAQHLGIVAIANIRGGGEYGEDWSDAGRKANLQTCLTDFQSAGEYLVKEKYSDQAKLIIHGGSHGGMLVGACTNQRPDLFGAAVPAVGVMDMLRFHKYTIGYAWKSNYGCSEDSKEEFDNLVNISPLNNIRVPEGGKYPAVLALTGDHDDRVVPSHTLKYMATLQHTMGSVATQDKPLLVRIDTKAGHGAGTPSSKKIEEVSDMYSFLVQAINLQYR